MKWLVLCLIVMPLQRQLCPSIGELGHKWLCHAKVQLNNRNAEPPQSPSPAWYSGTACRCIEWAVGSV